MKSFRFIQRHKSSDWLEVINADTLEEAIALYDRVHGEGDTEYEVQQIEDRKGCVLAFHITPNQAR